MTTTLSPSGGDDFPAIQAAVTALPATGGEIVLQGSGFKLSDSVIVNKNGVRIRGETVAQTLVDWTSVAVKPMFDVAGPLEGWGLDNLYLNGHDKAWGISARGANYGDCSNLRFRWCQRAIHGEPKDGSNAMHNLFRRTLVEFPFVAGARGISLEGVRGPGPAEGPNSCFWHFYDTLLALPGPGAVACDGIYLGETDTNTFVGTHIANGQAGSRGVVFDYGAGYSQPGGNLFVHLDNGTATTPFANVGTPGGVAGACANRIMGHSFGNGGAPVQLWGCIDDTDIAFNNQLCLRAKVPATGEAGLLLAVNRSGVTVLSQVKLGATNSGGSGKRALVIDN